MLQKTHFENVFHKIIKSYPIRLNSLLFIDISIYRSFHCNFGTALSQFRQIDIVRWRKAFYIDFVLFSYFPKYSINLPCIKAVQKLWYQKMVYKMHSSFLISVSAHILTIFFNNFYIVEEMFIKDSYKKVNVP